MDCPDCHKSWDMPLNPGDSCPWCMVVYRSEDAPETRVLERNLDVDNFDDLATVASFNASWRAHLSRDVLVTAGIPCIVTGEHGHLVRRWVGGVKLQVGASDLNAARRALADAREAHGQL